MRASLYMALLTALLVFGEGNGKNGKSAERGGVPEVFPVVLRVFPHNTASFTQGLIAANGTVYESTGIVGASSLQRIDAATGAVERTIAIPSVFAEGIGTMDDLLVQLTWKDERAFLYSFPSLNKAGEFSYAGEGWGLTADGAHWIMSNGSDTLYYRDKQFAVVKKLPVTCSGAPLRKLNELEYVNTRIYANVWYCDSIVAIEPHTGTVSYIVNCSVLAKQARLTGGADVLNGIAYDRKRGVFYITGKRWPVFFEVTITP